MQASIFYGNMQAGSCYRNMQASSCNSSSATACGSKFREPLPSERIAVPHQLSHPDPSARWTHISNTHPFPRIERNHSTH
jgi:hypothetical protein